MLSRLRQLVFLSIAVPLVLLAYFVVWLCTACYVCATGESEELSPGTARACGLAVIIGAVLLGFYWKYG